MAKHSAASRRVQRRAVWIGGIAVAAVLAVTGVLMATNIGGGHGSATSPAAAERAQPTSSTAGHRSSSAAPSCARHIPLRIAAASAIAPVIKAAAATTCVNATVTVDDTPQAAARLRAGAIDVWVPDSRARGVLAGAQAVRSAPSIAASPLVLAANPGLAAKLAPKGATSWAMLMNAKSWTGLTAQVEDTSTSSAALVLAATVNSLAHSAISDNYLALAAAAGGMARLQSAEPAGTLPANTARVIEARYLPKLPGAVAVPVAEGSPRLDFPWVDGKSAQGAGNVHNAAASVLAALSGPAANSARQQAGLLAPSATGYSAPGWPRAATVLAAPAYSQLSVLYALADSGNEHGNDLGVIDVSGSMGDPSGPQRVRPIDAIKSSFGLVTQFLSNQTGLALWKFGYQLAPPKDYIQLAPLTELTTANRAKLAATVQQLQAQDTGTSLNRTLLDAYSYMQAYWVSGKQNVVALFTDGRDEDAPGGLSTAQLVSQLRAKINPAKPIQVILFGYGNADIAAMKQIAGAAGGLVFKIDTPDEIIGALLQAVAQSAQLQFESAQ